MGRNAWLVLGSRSPAVTLTLGLRNYGALIPEWVRSAACGI